MAWLAPSTAALESLRSVHVPAFDRLLGRLSGTTRGRIELGLVTLVSLIAVGGGVLGVLRSGVLFASSPGLWTVAGLSAAGFGAGLTHGYALFVRGDRLGSGWQVELGQVLVAAVATALAGLLAGAARLSLTVPPAETGSASTVLWSQLSTAAGVAALGLCASLLLAVLWLLLRARGEVVRRARTELRETIGALHSEKTGPQRETRR